MALRIPGRKPPDGSSGDASERRAARLAKRQSGASPPSSSPPRTSPRGTGPAAPLVAGLAEILAIGREMVSIPAGVALRIAEWLGLRILAAWRFARPLLAAGLALGVRGSAVAARQATPARAIAFVALVAAAILALTQFLDYRDVQAGVPAYEGVESIAPAPVVDGTAETAGSAHLYVLLIVAIASAATVVMSLRGRWRLARALFFLGLATVAVAVFIDAPNGLEEGQTAVQFADAEARLLGTFWVEVFAGAVIAACGPLLALTLRPAAQERRSPAAGGARRDRERRASLSRSDVQGARS